MCGEAQKISKRITVFTPTYNRAYIIEKLYHSLQRQNFHDFEWLVVDDGSSDNTEQLFEKIQSQANPFPVRYIKSENGGKHRAINRGLQEAQGELFFIVDSDDHVTDTALETIDRIEKSLPEDQRDFFAGVSGIRCTPDGKTIGSNALEDPLDIPTLERDRYGVLGDKAEVYYTEVLRKYPFPTFEGEKFLTECVVWDRISAAGLKLRFTHDPLIVCEYLPDGLTAKIQSLHARNPRGYGLYLSQRIRYKLLRGKDKWAAYLDFYYVQRDNMSTKDMASCLHCNGVKLWTGLLAMRIRQKLTDR